MKKESTHGVWQYIRTSLVLLGIALLFSLFSLIMSIELIPWWVQFISAFIFLAPILYLTFAQGMREGGKLFKAYTKTSLDDVHSETADKIPYHRCVYHVLGFTVPLILLYIVSVALKNTIVRLIAMLFEFPVALLFSSVHVLDLSQATPVTLAIFLPYTLLWTGTFVAGYLLKIWQLRRQHAEMRGELRMFDN